MKVNITLDDALLQRLDNFADRNYMSRSGLISLSVNQYLNGNEMILAIKDMSISMRKIADSGTIDDETQQKLEDFERIAAMLTGVSK